MYQKFTWGKPVKVKLNPSPQDELDKLRELRLEVEMLLILTETDERFLREHGPTLRKMHDMVIVAKEYERATTGKVSR